MFLHSLIQISYSWTENGDSFDEAVREAKRWVKEKKAGLSSLTKLAQGTSNLNSETLEHVGDSSPSSYCYCVLIIEWRMIMFDPRYINGLRFLVMWSIIVTCCVPK